MITVSIEISARHVHLSAEDWRKLFPGDEPTSAKPISQPPQFIAVERVTVDGPNGKLEQVGIVGPLRPYTQVELAMTDARKLGLHPPLSDSGHLDHASQLTITGRSGSVSVNAAIIQQRHIHASPTDGQNYGLTDGQIVNVKVSGPRGGVFDQVLVRIHPDYVWRMHVDTDEANAFGVGPETTGEVIMA